MNNELKIKRGDIVLVNLDPTIGSEQGKTRPALVIQNDIGNEYSPVIIVASITSRIFGKQFLTNVVLKAQESSLDKNSTILFNQIRTIDKQRIIKKIGEIPSKQIPEVDRAIAKSLGINYLNLI